MDNFLTAMQYSAEQQQMCNALRNAYATLSNAHAVDFMNGAYLGYGPQAGPQFQAFNGAADEEYDDDEDDEDEEQMRTLFCNNLDERVTEEILYEVFLQAGPIESARIPLDNTGRQRNFGFVTYQHRSAVPYAVELYQGLELFQKKVTIRQQCLDKSKSSTPNRSNQRNPFAHDMGPPAMPLNDHVGPRHSRHSMHDNKNKFNNNDIRRQSDSAIIESNRRRMHQQHPHNSSGGSRRSDQRYSHGKKRLI
ncbi:RNA-binding protein 7 [Drosophila albomicans]|uniref:RNA-binding protein 7 n=1 Tax=Drosophila albomicans TaxID=7291 RepID=A0A6P8WMJ8_DROAB|nr:RNA-binding protein 7 [Drosophila albomicans]